MLRLIARGHCNKEVAARLSVSVMTVEAHKARGMREPGLVDSPALIAYVTFRGRVRND